MFVVNSVTGYGFGDLLIAEIAQLNADQKLCFKFIFLAASHGEESRVVFCRSTTVSFSDIGGDGYNGTPDLAGKGIGFFLWQMLNRAHV